MKMEPTGVPKRRHIKFRRLEITQERTQQISFDLRDLTLRDLFVERNFRI